MTSDAGRNLIRLAVCLLLAQVAGQVHAMWAAVDDRELVASSALIVEATYIGDATFQAGAEPASRLTLGVLQLQAVVKGKPGLAVVFVRTPTRHSQLRKSDDIVFANGQRGLWFLRADDAHPGLYLADHPQRFVPESQVADMIRSIRPFLP